jgi:hypothetical protein
MDKKAAEDEAIRKAKDQQAAAGKSSGMSGRDLVSVFHSPATYDAIAPCLGYPCSLIAAVVCHGLQFQYNPEWFAESDEEEGSDEEWDLDKFRREKEAEDIAREEERIRLLSLGGGDG